MTDTALQKKYAHLPHILVVDDDDRIRDLVARYLREHDFFVSTAQDAAQAAEILTLASYDALVLDVMMPGQDGMSFTHQLRSAHNDIPVLLLTAMGEMEDKIQGLTKGADDYLTKPFDPRELVLRLQAILRRKPTAQPVTSKTTIGHWQYDPRHKELLEEDRTVKLTDGEATLLEFLIQHKSQIVSRDALSAACDMDSEKRTIDVQVTRLRRKLEKNSEYPRYLQTVRGKGYVLYTDNLTEEA